MKVAFPSKNRDGRIRRHENSGLPRRFSKDMDKKLTY
jgi:hypothetical protein